MSFLGMDPPRHTRMRALVSRGFTPRRVAELEPRIREMAIGHLERMRARGRSEFIGDLAGRPADGRDLASCSGVPAPDRAELRAHADLLVHREEGVFDVPPAAGVAFGKIWQYFGELVEERRRAPKADLISALLAAEIDGVRLTVDGAAVLLQPDDRGGQRDHHEAARERALLAVAQSRPAQAPRRRPGPGPALGRGDAALRQLEPGDRPGHEPRGDAARCRDPARGSA